MNGILFFQISVSVYRRFVEKVIRKKEIYDFSLYILYYLKEVVGVERKYSKGPTLI